MSDRIRQATLIPFNRMAKAIQTSNAKQQRMLGISYKDIGLQNRVDQFRSANIALMEKAGRVYAQQVREVLEDPEFWDRTVDDLSDALVKRAGVSESRATLIARDQTLKLNRAITAHRQKSAGVERFQWSTSMDERVREEHQVLEGKIFSWTDPPPEIDDIQCRCAQLPLIEDIDGESDNEDA